jgi:hypothetical protein
MCLHGVQLKISRSNVQDIESGKWFCSTEMIMYKMQMHVHVICFGGYFDANWFVHNLLIKIQAGFFTNLCRPKAFQSDLVDELN